jgi:hypothetical protein
MKGLGTMATAVERIVVQTTARDKKAIAVKAKLLDMPISELMRRGAFAYESAESDAGLATLADAAGAAAERAGSAIDDALVFIEASNQRIAAMEAAAQAKTQKPSSRRAA